MNYKGQFELAKNRMTTKVEWISLEFAEYYLARNDMNRAVNQSTVKCYVEELKNGFWAVNGETIIISDEDTLVDGQQRLLAIVQTGIEVGSNVARGALKEDFNTLNQGRIRSNGTVYDLENPEQSKKIGTAMSAAVKAVHSYKNNGNMSDNFGMKFSPRMMNRIKNTLENNIETSVLYALNHKRGGLFTQSVIGSLHYVFSEINNDEAEQFLKALITGDYGDDIAIRELRNHFINLQLSGVKINRNRPYVCGVLIKGWNAWRKDKSALKKYDYKKGDGFPKAR